MSRGEMLRRPTPVALLSGTAWSALATYFSTGGNDITGLAWIAPVPILAFVFGHGAAERAGERTVPGAANRIISAAFAASLAGNLSWLVLYRGILPAVPILGFALLLAAAFAGVTATVLLVARRLGPFAGTVAFPSLWVAVEFAVARWSPHGTVASLAYTQADLIPLIQVASVTGLSGITFILLFTAASIAASLGDAGARVVRGPLLAAPAALVLAAFVFGGWRAGEVPAVGRVTVGLASFDPMMRLFETTKREEAERVLESYIEATGALASRGAEAVVWPEKALSLTPEYEEEFSRLLSSLAEKDEIFLIAGLNLTGRETPKNMASVYTRGRRVLAYEKRRLVPGFEEAYRRGDRAGVHRAPGGVLGVAICKDLDFPELFHEYSEQGVGVLFVPAWDFGRDAKLHARMAVMRGVEGGFSVARTAAEGQLAASDYFGRVVADLPTASNPRALLLADLPLGPGKTFYSRYGDWFAWMSVVLAAGLVAFAATRQVTARR